MTTILTPAQTSGPLFGFAMFPADLVNAPVWSADSRVVLSGTIYDGAGKPVGCNAFLEFWGPGQASRVRAIDGKFRTVVNKPERVRVPDVGLFAPHLSVGVFTQGLARHLVTRMYFPEETEANNEDIVMSQIDPARRQTLIAQRDAATSGLCFDIHLQGEAETVFFSFGPG